VKKHSEAFVALVDDARVRVAETTVADVKRRLDAGEKLTLVDVREDNEWQAGHLPQAQHIGRGVIERDIEERIPDRTTEVILYCGGGFRSVLAADNLQRMGYTNVLSMNGGFRQWRDSGFPLEGDTTPTDDGAT
jgi:rhodanese-related sulfurtransferase